jgi:translocation and assembly module TamA
MPCRPDRPAVAALLLAATLLSRASPATADIEVEIEGVTEEMAKNVRIFLSVERYRERDDVTQDTLDRLHDRVEREVRQAMRPFGHYEPRVTSDISRVDERDWRVVVRIDPGAPVVLRERSVEVHGPGANEPMFQDILRSSTLREGQRLDHGAYDKLKSDLQRTAVSNGFLDAKLVRNELLVDPPNRTATAIIAMETGRRYRFGATAIEQDAIRPELVRRFLRYREGEYFDTVALLHTQFALDDSQYFSVVEVIPGQRNPETLVVPIAIRAQAARRDRYSFGVGYGTDTRWRGTVTWDMSRVNDRGHRARIEVVAANLETSFEARYIIPVGDPALEKVSIDGIWSNEELADLEITRTELRPGLTQVQGRWQRVLFASLSEETTESTLEKRTDQLLVPGISYSLVPANFQGESLTFSRGLFAELVGSHSAFGSDADFLRLRLRDEHVFDLSQKWHLLLRAEIGLSMVADFSELPGSYRFFAGGDQSVRGFGLNELSPLDENGEKVGGRHLVVGSVEVIRDLPRNFGVAFFVDAGNAMDKLGDPLEYSVGVGLRWKLPVVTLGIDVAQAISEGGHNPRFHLNISPVL